MGFYHEIDISFGRENFLCAQFRQYKICKYESDLGK